MIDPPRAASVSVHQIERAETLTRAGTSAYVRDRAPVGGPGGIAAGDEIARPLPQAAAVGVDDEDPAPLRLDPTLEDDPAPVRRPVLARVPDRARRQLTLTAAGGIHHEDVRYREVLSDPDVRDLTVRRRSFGVLGRTGKERSAEAERCQNRDRQHATVHEVLPPKPEVTVSPHARDGG